MVDLQVKYVGGRISLFIPLVLCFLSSLVSALSVHLSSSSSLPPPDTLAFNSASLISSGDDVAIAAAAASPIGQFDTFGGFDGPKAISSNLENLSDFGDVDKQFDSSSGFERAASSANRRVDNDPFFTYNAPTTAAVAPAVTFQRYNPQAASGFDAALSAAAATSSAAVPSSDLPLLASYTPTKPRSVASPYLSPLSAPAPSAGGGGGALPLHLPGYTVPLYPPAPASYRTSASAAAPAPASYTPYTPYTPHAPYKPKPVPSPYRGSNSSPYRSSAAAAIPSAGHYSTLHAGKPSSSGATSGAISAALDEEFSVPQAAPSQTNSFGGDFEGFSFSGSLSEGKGSPEGFDFGSEEF